MTRVVLEVRPLGHNKYALDLSCGHVIILDGDVTPYASYAKIKECPCCSSGEGDEASFRPEKSKAHSDAMMAVALNVFAATVLIAAAIVTLLSMLSRIF